MSRRTSRTEREIRAATARAADLVCSCTPVPSHHVLTVWVGGKERRLEVARDVAHEAVALIADRLTCWPLRGELLGASWVIAVRLLNGSTAAVWAPGVTGWELESVADESGVAAVACEVRDQGRFG